jgi:hypothetical protein
VKRNCRTRNCLMPTIFCQYWLFSLPVRAWNTTKAYTESRHVWQSSREKHVRTRWYRVGWKRPRWHRQSKWHSACSGKTVSASKVLLIQLWRGSDVRACAQKYFHSNLALFWCTCKHLFLVLGLFHSYHDELHNKIVSVGLLWFLVAIATYNLSDSFVIIDLAQILGLFLVVKSVSHPPISWVKWHNCTWSKMAYICHFALTKAK